MANPVHIAEVIAAIKGEAGTMREIGFNMGAYIGPAVDGVITDALGRDCGTVACIAGHAYLLATGGTIEDGINAESDDIELTAAEFLGINEEQAAELFYDLPIDFRLGDVTSNEAIATLEHLARTGEVEWQFTEPMRMAA